MPKKEPLPITIVNAFISASAKKVYESHEIAEEDFQRFGEYAFEAAVASMGYKKATKKPEV